MSTHQHPLASPSVEWLSWASHHDTQAFSSKSVAVLLSYLRKLETIYYHVNVNIVNTVIIVYSVLSVTACIFATKKTHKKITVPAHTSTTWPLFSSLHSCRRPELLQLYLCDILPCAPGLGHGGCRTNMDKVDIDCYTGPSGSLM